MGKIIKNQVRCKLCGDEPESKHRHDFRPCKCGNVIVDGGKDYLRRVFSTREWEDISIEENDDIQVKHKPDVSEQIL